MTVEKFLIFWDHNNIIIIEGLVALIIATSLFVAYRGFFSKKGDDSDHAMGGGIDAAQLEKTLQKILENQKGGGANGAGEDMNMHVDIPPDADGTGGATTRGGGESAAETASLKKALAERQQQIDTLQAKVKEAVAAAEASAAAAGGGGGAGLSVSEQNALNDKIRDLEARLSEYEIISEDIADLSKYRDENDKLKAELEALKAGGGAAPAAAPQAPAAPAAPAASQPPPAAAAPEIAAAAPSPEPTPEAASVIDDDLMAEFAAAVGDQKANAPPPKERPAPTLTDAEAADALADSASSEAVIDDDLMKEFEAAVAGQKLDSAAEKAGKGDEASQKTGDDTEKLMDEFQSFVTKKS